MNYRVSVGMECHAELLTASKMFCSCANAFGGEPNTRTCPVCLGLPGTLPVFNAVAVELVVKTALALHCDISMRTIFHRKNYFYPDLPKGYQVSQYGDTPIGTNGYVDIEKADGTTKRIRITRVHLEEDTGKSIHSDGLGYSVMDYNRAGVPLMEIVTDFPPDVESAEEARLYAETLRGILLYVGASDGRMEQGSLRVEPNPSVRKEGTEAFGVKTELKNLNSFRAVQLGIEYEAKRQIAQIEAGETVLQATYGWDAEKGVTVLQRVKETEQEYRYFPEPDLIPIEFAPEYIETMRASLPELALDKKNRFVSEYALPVADAATLVSDKATADFYERAVSAGGDPKAVANWILGELTRLASGAKIAIAGGKVSPETLAELTRTVADGTITTTIAKRVLEEMWTTGETATAVIDRLGLRVAGADAVAEMVAAVVAAHPDIVAKIKGGNEKVIAFLKGQVMKEAKGQARPDDIDRLLKDAIDKA
ncbi:MAG: Asp-tRNA(Asn)/Glu-tRNA(Gln) amidotransferase subunit GatB [Armatimonadetes bacterium]|nr:Asp-tRNA(Asn)/Glu-tRNA(Gln) amidotransferase subunit GatB [Armatimonadota bacterium]